MGERLASAISPYLRSHASNPVDWWPWGEEAFAEAARRDVPMLVSIGYATCHWCHVMARESFSDPELAAYLDEHFVAIKVDREEHPDVDAAYLAAASAFTPHLGWPLTVFATPDGRAFYAGTYFPPRPVQGVPAFRQVLEAIVEAWNERRGEVEATGAAVADALAARPEPADGALPSNRQLAAAVAELAGFEDPEFGGFGTDAKFPNAPVLSFLAERALHGDEAAAVLGARLYAATTALRDPVEGGYFRYADENLRLTEKFTRVSEDMLRYEFTVEDPTVWTRPWTAAIYWKKSGGQIYEYACHEGNYSLSGMLSALRAEDTPNAR